jgi:hypothetical protein
VKISENKATEVKIAYIGGGSRGWAWGLMSDLVSCEDMSGDVFLYDIDYEEKYGSGMLDLEKIPADKMNITFTDSGAKWYNSLFVDMDYYDDDDDDYEEDDQLSDSFKNNMF